MRDTEETSKGVCMENSGSWCKENWEPIWGLPTESRGVQVEQVRRMPLLCQGT